MPTYNLQHLGIVVNNFLKFFFTFFKKRFQKDFSHPVFAILGPSNAVFTFSTLEKNIFHQSVFEVDQKKKLARPGTF